MYVTNEIAIHYVKIVQNLTSWANGKTSEQLLHTLENYSLEIDHLGMFYYTTKLQDKCYFMDITYLDCEKYT